MSWLKKSLSRHLAIALAAASVLLPVIVCAQSQGPSPTGVQWQSLDQALRTAKVRKKAVFVMVYADWCGYCHQMEATTFRDPQIIAKLSGTFVPAKLNGESTRIMDLEKGRISEGDWAMRQGVQGFPSLIVLDFKGRTVVQYPGYMTTPQTSRFLADVGEFLQRGGIDKLGNFLDWAEKKG